MAPMAQRPAGRTARALPDRLRIDLYAHLSRMLDAGMSATEALHLLSSHARGRAQTALESLTARLQAGATFAQAADAAPALFPPESLGLLPAGEATGGLPQTLAALAASLELSQDLRRQVIRACIYPFVLYTLVFFVPRMDVLFTAGLAGYLQASLVPWAFTTALLMALIWLLPRFARLLLGRERLSRLQNRLPVVGKLKKLGADVRLARHLGRALAAGLPVQTAIALATRASGDPGLRVAGEAIALALEQGATLSEAFGRAGRFDEGLLLALASGERAGRLPESLEDHARLTQATLQHRLQVAVQLLSIGILLGTYLFAARVVLSDFEAVLGGTSKELEQVMKELGGGQGLEDSLKRAEELKRELPPELRNLLP